MSIPDEQLPNPYTPMAFFPPELAFQITVAKYVLVGSLSVTIWDILLNIHSDWEMLKMGRICISICLYFISRLSTLAYLLGLTIVETAPVRNCESIHTLQILLLVASSTNSCLLFLRIRAMYINNNWVVAFFFFMWLAVVGGSVTPTQGISGSNIGTTGYCINSRLEPYVFISCLIPTINDTLIFCATTWRLMDNSYVNLNIKNGPSIAILGRHLPAFSRSLLKDGQAYYLTTVGINIVTAALFFDNSIPIVYRSFIGIPNVALMNNMACYIYRKIRLRIHMECPANTLNVVSELPTVLAIGPDQRSEAASASDLNGTSMISFATDDKTSDLKFTEPSRAWQSALPV